MDETDLEQEARRERLRAWVKDHGGHARVAADRKLTPSQASYLSQVCNGYSFAARGARGMERRLGIPAKWLDQPSPGTAGTTQTYPAPGPSTADATSVAPPPRPNPRFKDRRDVSESDFALLEATKLVLTDAEKESILERARKIEELAERLVAARVGKDGGA